MKRTGKLSRHTPLARTGRVTPRKRTKAETTRVYGSTDRIAWMHAHGCLACGRGPSEIAHVRNGGTGRKSSAAETVPLCPTHHRMQHDLGIKSFERVFAVELHDKTLAEWAVAIDAAWQAWEAECA